jgi:hypothetical protein
MEKTKFMNQMAITNQLIDLITSKSLKEVLEQSIYQHTEEFDSKSVSQ